MNTSQWINQTREQANIMLEAAKRVEAGECVADVVKNPYSAPYTNNSFPTWNWMEYPYVLITKPVYRPWTAKEWGARIGDEFLVSGKRQRLLRIDNDGSDENLYFGSGANWYSFASNEIKLPNGAPCGELETTKKP